MKNLEQVQQQLIDIQTSINEGFWVELVEANQNKETTLGFILREIEFNEGGDAWKDDNLFSISGDNGMEHFTFHQIILFIRETTTK